MTPAEIETVKSALDWIEAQPEPRMIGAHKVIDAIKQMLANDALEKMAENARELGLNYDQIS